MAIAYQQGKIALSFYHRYSWYHWQVLVAKQRKNKWKHTWKIWVCSYLLALMIHILSCFKNQLKQFQNCWLWFWGCVKNEWGVRRLENEKYNNVFKSNRRRIGKLLLNCFGFLLYSALSSPLKYCHKQSNDL